MFFCYYNSMHLIMFNFSWMSFNILLSIIPIVFGILMVKFRNLIVRYTFAIGWILFLPNTIYLFTDIINLMKQWVMADPSLRFVLFFQYVILEFFGFVTFILAIHPLEKYILAKKFDKERIQLLIVILNFAVALGITLGRVERLNSWDVVSSPGSVMRSTIHIFSSLELIGLTVLFALFINFFYFLFKKPVVRCFSIYLNRVGV